MKQNYKVGDKVVGRWGGETFRGTIVNIEYDEGHDEMVADLDTDRWCYLSSIVRKIS